MSTLIIGVGGAGCSLVGGMPSSSNHKLIAVSSDADAIKSVGAEAKLLIEEGLQELAVEAQAELRSLMSGYKKLQVLVGLGGGTASCIAGHIATLGYDMRLNTSLVTILPFSIEGERRNIALKAMDQFVDAPFQVRRLDNDLLLPPDHTGTLLDAIEVINRNIISEVSAA